MSHGLLALGGAGGKPVELLAWHSGCFVLGYMIIHVSFTATFLVL
jgi:hypothetical protein